MKTATNKVRTMAKLSDTDYSGRTFEQEIEAARKAQAQQDPAGPSLGRRATVGRLFHTARRWTWAFRWELVGQTGRIDLDGVTFEVVAQV